MKTKLFEFGAIFFVICLFVGCGSNGKEKNNDIKNHETADEETSDTEQQTGDTEQTTDSESNVNDSENVGDSDSETNDLDFEEYVAEFCEPFDVVIGGNESCPASVNYQGNYWFSTILGRSDGIMSIEKVEAYDYRPDSNTFNVDISGTCTNIDNNSDPQPEPCNVVVEYATIDMFDDVALVGKKLEFHFKKVNFTAENSVVRGAWMDTEAWILTDGAGDLLAMGAQVVYGHDIGEQFSAEEVADLKLELHLPDDCAIAGCSFSQDCDGKNFIDVIMWPPIKFTRNGKSVVVRNWESIEMDDYVYSVRNSIAAHEKDPDQQVSDSGSRYYFDFSVFNKKSFGFK